MRNPFNRNMKKIIKISVVSILVLVFSLIFFKDRFSNKIKPVVMETNRGNIQLDLDGDGNKDYVVVKNPEDINSRVIEKMIAYDSSDKEIGKLPFDMPINIPMDKSFKTYLVKSDDKIELFSMDFTVGPHQMETMFFGLTRDLLLPVCFVGQPTGPYDCLFYSGNIGGLIVEDVDNNGSLDVIETVDEYPTDGKLSSIEEEAIDNEFKEQDVTEFSQDAKRIAIREKGGRGRPVAWAVYSYNGAFFEPQIDNSYETIFTSLNKKYPQLIKKSQLSKDSLEYNEFTRNFWSKKN
ncbi:MAG: hypothetical protein Q7R97_05590 [Candidatus Daviesbacteria bacterium]|nr:hypothetical protein [Candidatus Daviesbacteria bacterium]